MTKIDSVSFGIAKNMHLGNRLIVGGVGVTLLGVLCTVVGIFVRSGEEVLFADESDREFNNVSIEDVQDWYAQVID